MQATDEITVPFRSKVADLRRVPLAEMSALSTAFGGAPGRVAPDSQAVPPVPGALFSSSI